MTTSHTTLSTVTVIMNADDPEHRFQIVPYTSETNGSIAKPIHTCRGRGDATSWLLCNGYQWVKDSQPEQWVKS